ncbi:MAG: EpsG family protein, partial [Bacteroidales bacterium]|nr:EpsG family protein [Bacteroidales bacterium]
MIYLLIFLVSIGILYIYRNQVNLGVCLFVVLPLALLAGLRDVEIGTDTQHYVYSLFTGLCYVDTIDVFEYSSIKIETGYYIWNYFISSFTSDFNVYLTITHFLMYGLVLYALYRLRNFSGTYIWLGLFIFTLLFYRTTLNIARQSIALCICILSMSLLLNNYHRRIILILLLLLAYLFHRSAIIFASVFLLKWFIYKDWIKFDTLRFKLLSVVCFVFAFTFFVNIVGWLQSLGIITEKYDSYLDDARFGTNVPISDFALTIVNLIFVLIVKMLNKSDSFLCLAEYLFLIAVMICFFGQISTYAVRIGIFFEYIYILIIPIMFARYSININIKCAYLLF